MSETYQVEEIAPEIEVELDLLLDLLRRTAQLLGEKVVGEPTSGGSGTKSRPPWNGQTASAHYLACHRIGVACQEFELSVRGVTLQPTKLRVFSIPHVLHILDRVVPLIRQLHAGDYQRELTRLLHTFRSIKETLQALPVIDERSPMITLRSGCPHCAQKTLRVRKDGSSSVTCANPECRDAEGRVHSWNRADWALLVRMLEARS